MRIIGCDLHARQQTLTMLDTTTGEVIAAFQTYDHILAPGAVGTLMILAADRRQAQTIFGYVRGFFQTPMLRSMVVSELKESLTLNNRVRVEIHTCSYKTTRGFTLVGCIADELAFWRTEESANPAGEVLAALRPGLSTTNGLLLGISSPYSKSGALYDAFREHYGKADSPVLVWKATSREMNPTLNPLVASARERPPARSPRKCPECQSTCLVKLYARWHCNSCGIDFGPLPVVA